MPLQFIPLSSLLPGNVAFGYRHGIGPILGAFAQAADPFASTGAQKELTTGETTPLG
jgi:hypothetical protein